MQLRGSSSTGEEEWRDDGEGEGGKNRVVGKRGRVKKRRGSVRDMKYKSRKEIRKSLWYRNMYEVMEMETKDG